MPKERFTPDEPPAGVPLWFITYADMCGLLLGFFIVLFGLSEIKKEKFETYAGAMREFFNYKTGAPKKLDISKMKGAFKDEIGEYLRKMMTSENGKVAAREGVQGKNIAVHKVREGLKATIGSRALFDVGSAHLRLEDPLVVAALTELAKELRGYHLMISVVGYASPNESGKIIEPGVTTLRELSLRRARNVWDFLVNRIDKQLRIPDQRIEIVGRGPYGYPKNSNSLEEDAGARSVEITISEERAFFEGEQYKVQ